MRLFDLAGFFFVAVWLIVVGAFVVTAGDDGDPVGLSLTDGVVDLREDTVWMTVYRAGEEVGVLREDRTRLIDGWLIELQGIIKLKLMGDTYAFRFVSRSTLDEELILRSANANVQAFGMELTMNGQLRTDDDGASFHVDVNLDGAVERFVADLDEPPHLAIHAIPQMIASDDLEEGAYFEQEFFDPLTLSPSDIRVVYEGRDEIVNMDGEHVDAYAFTQTMGGFTSEIRTDARGMVIQQTLPLQVAIARLPEPLGRNLFVDLEEVFDEQSGRAPPFIDAIDVEALLTLTARFGSGEIDRLRPIDAGDSEADDEPVAERRSSREFELSPLPDPEHLDLMGPRQHVAFQTSNEARLQTGDTNPLWYAGLAPENSSYEAQTTPEDHPDVADLADELKTGLESDEERLHPRSLNAAADRFCRRDEFGDSRTVFDNPWPTALPDEAASPLDCLALFADALAIAERPPHFVHGVAVDNGDVHPRVWLAVYRDGKYLGAVDPLSDDATVGPDQLQLYIDDQYAPERLADLVDIATPN